MKIVEHVLLAQRTDGKFLRLHKSHTTTSWDYVDDPTLAERVYVSYYADGETFENFTPKEAPYYFENSHRAREIWLKDCKMVKYVITTNVKAKKV